MWPKNSAASKKLNMGQIIGQTDFNFLNKRSIRSGGFWGFDSQSVLARYSTRGTDLLNIDFTGGSSVTMVFKDGQELDFSEVKETAFREDRSRRKEPFARQSWRRRESAIRSAPSSKTFKKFRRSAARSLWRPAARPTKIEASEVSSLSTQTGRSRKVPDANFVSLVSFQPEEDGIRG